MTEERLNHMWNNILLKWRSRQITWPAFALIVLLVLSLFIGGSIMNSLDLHAAQKVQSDLQVNLSKAEARRNALTKEFEAIGSKPYLAARAREESHYLQNDEIRFIIDKEERLDNYPQDEFDTLVKELTTMNR